MCIRDSYTGKDIPIDIVWLKRDHDYSVSRLKTKIHGSVEDYMEKMEGIL